MKKMVQHKIFFFSTFILVPRESRKYFNCLLSPEVCTYLQIKRFPLMKLPYTIWKYGGSAFQTNNIKKHPCHIYSSWNCLSWNLLVIRLIITTLLWLLQKDLRKTLKTVYHHFSTYPPDIGRSKSYHYGNTK